jgi:hypothetical protein
MLRISNALLALAVAVLLIASTGSVVAQEGTTTVDIKKGEVVRVVGNNLYVKVEGEKGVKKIAVPKGTMFNVGGQQLTLEQLRPGMDVERTKVITTSGAVIVSEEEMQRDMTVTQKQPPPQPRRTPPPPPPPPRPAPKPAAMPATGGPLPLIGLLGAACLALGSGLSSIRRRR